MSYKTLYSTRPATHFYCQVSRLRSHTISSDLDVVLIFEITGDCGRSKSRDLTVKVSSFAGRTKHFIIHKSQDRPGATKWARMVPCGERQISAFSARIAQLPYWDLMRRMPPFSATSSPLDDQDRLGYLNTPFPGPLLGS